MTELNTESTVPPEFYKKASRYAFYAMPMYVLVPLLFWWWFENVGISVDWRAYGLGVFGWIFALALRVPVTLFAKRLPEKRAMNLVVSISGPCEELIRLAVVLLTWRTVSWAASVGQGWAAIEVVNAIVSGMMLAVLFRRTDEKALQAKEMLEAQSGGKMTSNPVWGILERLFSSGYHIGATLLVAWNPWTVLLLIPYHSMMNLVVIRLMRKSLVLVEGWVAVTGTLAFVVGLIVFHVM